MAALGRGGASAVLRGAHERPGVVHLPFPGWAALVPRVAASSPDRSHHLGADGAARSALAASSTHLPSVSLEATWRCHLRQEPSAVIPLAGIRGGGYEQSSISTPTRSMRWMCSPSELEPDRALRRREQNEDEPGARHALLDAAPLHPNLCLVLVGLELGLDLHARGLQLELLLQLLDPPGAVERPLALQAVR